MNLGEMLGQSQYEEPRKDLRSSAETRSSPMKPWIAQPMLWRAGSCGRVCNPVTALPSTGAIPLRW